jgi:hypothetical protein
VPPVGGFIRGLKSNVQRRRVVGELLEKDLVQIIGDRLLLILIAPSHRIAIRDPLQRQPARFGLSFLDGQKIPAQFSAVALNVPLAFAMGTRVG